MKNSIIIVLIIAGVLVAIYAISSQMKNKKIDLEIARQEKEKEAIEAAQGTPSGNISSAAGSISNIFSQIAGMVNQDNEAEPTS